MDIIVPPFEHPNAAPHAPLVRSKSRSDHRCPASRSLRHRVAQHIGIGIDATGQSDRVSLQISPQHRIMVPVVVVVQTGFCIMDLVGKGIVHHRAGAIGLRLAGC